MILQMMIYLIKTLIIIFTNTLFLNTAKGNEILENKIIFKINNNI